jgi:branched-chain amino acid aminotransferase
MKKLNNRLVFFNKKFIPEHEAKISIYDSALMFGDMIFEMTRSFNKKQFLLEKHIDRLLLGIKILRTPIKYSKKEILDFCYQTIEKNKNSFERDDEHRLMIDVSRGLLSIYNNIKGLQNGPNLIIADFPLKWTVQGMGKLFDQGINAVITSQRAIPSMFMDPKIKNRSRLFYLNANIEASQFKGENNWALLLDSNGFIAEGTGDNFFIIKDKKVFTPKGKDILRGISRDYVINVLCRNLKIQVYEKNIEPYDVYNADEAFMTGTPFCMLPVVSLNGLEVGNGQRGKLFDKILSKWSANVDLDIEKQIKNWDKKNLEKNNTTTGITPYKFK